MSAIFTQSDLLRDLHVLGTAPGDLLFVHSSYKSLDTVEGGAEAVIGALEDAVRMGCWPKSPRTRRPGSNDETDFSIGIGE